MNQVIKSIPNLKGILQVTSPENFHPFFVNNAINIYIKNLKKNTPLGNILALGANHVEAESLIKFPFKKIILTGINPADEKTLAIIKKDKRVSYEIEDMESLSYKSSSFDIVFVKEAIHHVPRPAIAVYEMLRVSKRAIIFIEPCETFIGKMLERLGLSSRYEKNQFEGKKFRDNYVYRWSREEIVKTLNSYYLESGYKVIFSNCWMSNRYNAKYPLLTKVFNTIGWLISFVPRNEGNYMSCIIFAGKDAPKEI